MNRRELTGSLLAGGDPRVPAGEGANDKGRGGERTTGEQGCAAWGSGYGATSSLSGFRTGSGQLGLG